MWLPCRWKVREGDRVRDRARKYVDGAAELLEVQGLELAVCGSSIRSGIANFSNLCGFWNHMPDRRMLKGNNGIR